MEKITGMDWLKKQIKEIEITNSQHKDIIDTIKNISNKTYNEFQTWTPLKLILLNYSLSVCTTIIYKIISENKNIFEKMFFIDLFAGSGINKIKDSNDFLIGSPLISVLNYGDYYNELIFCEEKKEFYDALEKRLSILKRNNIQLFHGSYKENIEKILYKVNKRGVYSFFFIDPYCMEMQWQDFEKILKTRSDIIINFMSLFIYREICAGKERKNSFALNSLFGDESWKEINNLDDVIILYKKKIRSIRKNAPIKIIKIRSEKNGFCYHLFFITNKTKNENRWLRAIDKAKDEIEQNTDLAVKHALDIVKDRQKQIFDF